MVSRHTALAHAWRSRSAQWSPSPPRSWTHRPCEAACRGARPAATTARDKQHTAEDEGERGALGNREATRRSSPAPVMRQ